MPKLAPDMLGEQPIFLSTVAPGRGDRRFALAVVLLSLLSFVAAIPFARTQLSEVSAFIPVYQSALIISDSITAVLLYAQFNNLRSRALLVLASGYLFAAVIAALHMLTFPGLFSPGGLLGAGPQTTAWLYMFWHAGFPLAVIGYALLKGRDGETSQTFKSPSSAIYFGAGIAIAAACAFTLLATAGHAQLPEVMRGHNYTSAMIVAVSAVWTLSFAALAVLWKRRPHTLLDLWLMVVMCAWIFHVAMSAVFNSGRFDLGFYAGRVYGLLAGTLVLLVLLLETGRLYTRFVRSLRAEQDERKREMEERSRFFETSLDLILVTDRKGDFVRVNPSSMAILGYRPEEMIGHSAVAFLHGDDLEPTRNEMRQARRGKGIRNFESRYIHKDGRVITLAWTGVWSEPVQLYFFIGRDMTEQQKAAKALRDSERHFRLLVGGVTDHALYMLDPRGNVTSWNAGAERITGYTAEEIVGRHFNSFHTPEDNAAGLPGQSLAVAAREGRYVGEGWRICKDGSRFLASVSIDAIHEDNGDLLGFAKITRDITERKKAEDKLNHLAHYDQLTGLPNRITLQRELKDLLEPAAGPHVRPTSLVLLDLDDFKSINDTLGHSVGDRLLREVARRLIATAGGNANVYRLGGDEFVAIFPQCGDPRVLGHAVDRMLEQLAQPFQIDGRVLHVGASAGITIGPADGATVDDLIANADLALYDAKSHGGRQYRLFIPIFRAQAEARRELDSELRRALFENEFELYFQPQVRLSDGAVVGAEALLRWRHPRHGIVGPGAFIEALTQSAIAREVGTWILRQACATAAAWRDQELPPLRIGVNLFPAQFHPETLQQDVEDALLQTGLAPDALELEITENIALGKDEKMLPPLLALRKMGVDLAFDDFGTGYASLSYLTRYPLSRIKIDQSFVRNMDVSPQSTAIVRSTIIMAHNLGLSVIAEGVETPAQAAFLRNEGCEEAQGFLYAKPLPRSEFEAFLRAASTPAGRRRAQRRSELRSTSPRLREVGA